MSRVKTLLADARLHHTHWGKRIIAAEERGEFTDADFIAAIGWTTCACGKQSPMIPRRDNKEPEDYKLRRLGCVFPENITDQDFVAAARTLIAIEARAEEVAHEEAVRKGLVPPTPVGLTVDEEKTPLLTR